MVAAGSLGSIALVSGTAGASAPTVTCTKGTISATGSGTITGCSDKANTGGSGKIVATLKTKTGVITWNKTGTTKFKYTYADVKNTACSPKTKGSLEVKETATVTGGTGKAAASIKKGQVATTTICVIGGKVGLAPGSKYQI
jgi:hypothetical protein